jgi:phage gpG-like protein
MAVSLSIRVEGIPELKAQLDRVNPKKNTAWMRDSLGDCGLLTQKIAAEEKIIRGGSFRGKSGPRGGKGKLQNAGVHPKKLTSRTGTLRRSIRVNRSPLPWAVEVGTDLTYGAVHEEGWSGTQRIPSHTRTVVFGRKVAPFRVNAFSRNVRYPARPYLGPGLEKAAKSFSDIFIRKLRKYLP